MQIIDNKFMRYDLGILPKPIKATILDNLQNLLARKQESQSSKHNKNNSENKVITTHHLFTTDIFNIFIHSLVTF